MKSPNLGNFEIEVYSFSSGQERFVGKEPIQIYLDSYWGFVKSADDRINYLVEFMTFKDSYIWNCFLMTKLNASPILCQRRF